MPIRILTDEVAARIAAGEVVERPASVVKELVENALDSGASRIEIDVRKSGLQSISVTDDGGGMPPEDIALALVRHATSKLVDDDILKVRTLGYRGEALPSIAAMATVRIVSRPVGQDVAFMVSASGGAPMRPRPSAGREGTSVRVENLFAAHPARRKFMKSDRAEAAAVREAIADLALAAPGVDIRAVVNEVQVLYPSRKDFFDRSKDILGLDEEDLVVLDHRDGAVAVAGAVSLPSARRSQMLKFVVNGRPVSDRNLKAAVTAAYVSNTGPGTVPSGCISITLPSVDLDVNVHPRKSEVRFSCPDVVAAAVWEAIEKAMSSAGIRSPSSLADLARSLAMPSLPEGDRRRLPLGRFLGQANGSWLICETSNGIAIVDQHAAHERVVMERLKASLSAAGPAPRDLERPYLHRCTYEVSEAVLDLQGDLEGLGIVVGQHPNGFELLAVSAALGPVSAAPVCEALAVVASSGLARAAVAQALWDKVPTAACRAAIKAGDGLDHERADTLLREIEATPNGGWCNHGRPSVVFLKHEEVAKLFART